MFMTFPKKSQGLGRLFLGLLLGLPVNASAIYSNFGAPFSGTGYSIASSSSTALGVRFTATGSGFLATIRMPVAVDSGGVLTAGLFADSSGQPGSLIESWPASDIPSIPPIDFYPLPVVTLVSTLNPALSAGAVYWFVVRDTAASSIIWDGSGLPLTGGAWLQPGSGPLLQIDATQAPPAIDLEATPEPAPLLMLGFGLGVLCAFEKARRFARIRPEPQHDRRLTRDSSSVTMSIGESPL